MNKTTLRAAGTAALATLIGFCAPAQAQSNDWNSSNFYVGGYGGYSWSNATPSGGPGLNVNGGDYGIFGGYKLDTLLSGNANSGMTGALELHYGSSSGSDSKTLAGPATFSVSQGQEWGVSFRPGFTFLSDAMPLGLNPYGILGYRRTDFQTTTTATGSSTRGYNGFELGAGTELITYKTVGLRLDYTHVFYDSSAEIHPGEDDLRAAVVFHF